MSECWTVRLSHPADVKSWRAAARRLVSADVAPESIVWQAEDGTEDLFTAASVALPVERRSRPLRVPAGFLTLAEQAACHRDPDRFALLYRVLWRIAKGEAKVLDDATDGDVHRLDHMSRAVRRDRHKMHAFVRFRRLRSVSPEYFVAWFEPDHHIVRLASGFFQRRFANMAWSILTPGESVHWDRHSIVFGPGGGRALLPGEEPTETLWRTYFSNTFNPARLRIDAMRSEMPVKYWKNLPEAPLIAGLVHSAGTRSTRMVEASPTTHSRFTRAAMAPAVAMKSPSKLQAGASIDPKADPETDSVVVLPRYASLDSLRGDCSRCQRCEHACRATHAVPGEGNLHARVMLVGEQAGDQEDLQGRPFVGPAGQLLRTLLAELDASPDDFYLTNAVRHFTYEVRGKHRLHKRPCNEAIDNCRPWLFEEIRLVNPEVIVALGGSAGRALLGRTVRVGVERQTPRRFGDRATYLQTVHPASVLREQSACSRREARTNLKRDLAEALAWCNR